MQSRGEFRAYISMFPDFLSTDFTAKLVCVLGTNVKNTLIELINTQFTFLSSGKIKLRKKNCNLRWGKRAGLSG